MQNTQLRLIDGGRQDRHSGLHFFHAAVAFAALSFVALLFVFAAAVVVLSLERL